MFICGLKGCGVQTAQRLTSDISRRVSAFLCSVGPPLLSLCQHLKSRSCGEKQHMLQTDRLAKPFKRAAKSKGLFLSSFSAKDFISAVELMTYKLQSVGGAG